MVFGRRPAATKTVGNGEDFGYLPNDACYLDAACQTLRPQCVIDAEREYYTQYNACGGRVKYRWGQLVDGKVQDTRKRLLEFTGKSEKEYCVAFTLNTTYGINLLVHQLPKGCFGRIVTSDIEHNSVLLPSLTWAEREKAEHRVLARAEDGSLQYEPSDLNHAVVLLNSVSNIDGRRLLNLQELADDTHAKDGLCLVDAAQAFAHDPQLLRDADVDAIFGSGHKMYGPSIGFIILKRSLLETLAPFFIGGGTVTDARETGFDLLRTGDEAHALLEPGLQNWSGILGLGRAVQWLKEHGDPLHEAALAARLFEGLRAMDRVQLLNAQASAVTSFSVDGLDAHALALYLSERNIMCRSGYFCCHSYLQHKRALPPQLRVSLGLYNTTAHVDFFLETLKTILHAV